MGSHCDNIFVVKERRIMLKIENLTKNFGEKVAVDNLSLEVKPGELCAFIGHNGAGKTTTLKCIAGILQPTAGEIIIDGVSINSDAMLCKRKLAYIPDNPDVYEFMTASEFLNFVGDIYSVPQNKRKEIIDKYAKLFEIDNVLGNTIASYSHGMKQKVVLLSALIHSPKLLILDEPFVGLDPKASHDLKLTMKDFCKDGGAIFFSTHVLDVAEKLCDTVAIIKNGKLVKHGSMAEIKGDKSLEQLFLETE